MQQRLDAVLAISRLSQSRLTPAEQVQRKAWEADLRRLMERLENAPNSLETFERGDQPTRVPFERDEVVRTSKRLA
jgi:hypothetical protein